MYRLVSPIPYICIPQKPRISEFQNHVSACIALYRPCHIYVSPKNLEFQNFRTMYRHVSPCIAHTMYMYPPTNLEFQNFRTMYRHVSPSIAHTMYMYPPKTWNFRISE